MQDSLKRFIDENRTEFDDRFPSPDLWERIAEGSPQVQKAGRRQTVFVFGRIAAAVVVLMLVALGWQLLSNRKVVTEGYVVNETSLDTEVHEAAMYYEVEIERKSQMVFELTSNQPAIREGVQVDLAELDVVLGQLKNDLKDNVDNAEVLAAMIQNYRLKLDILEQILSFVEEKASNSENKEIHEL